MGARIEKAEPNGLLRANPTESLWRLSRGDGEDTSLTNQRMVVRVEWAQLFVPSRVAPQDMIFSPVPASLAGTGFLFSSCPKERIGGTQNETSKQEHR